MFAQRLWGGKHLLWSSLFFRADGLPCWIYRRMYHKSLLRWPFLIKCESKGRELIWVQTIRLLWLRKSFKACVKYGYYSKHWCKPADGKENPELWLWTEHNLFPSIYMITVIDKHSTLCSYSALRGLVLTKWTLWMRDYESQTVTPL